MTIHIKGLKRTLNRSGGSLSVTIPSEIIDKMELKEGDELTFNVEEKTKGLFMAVYKE